VVERLLAFLSQRFRDMRRFYEMRANLLFGHPDKIIPA
jgi:hypothetical protein